MAKQTFTTGQVLTAAQMTSLQQTAMGGGSATAKTANYVLVAADAGTTVAMNAAGATTITVNTSLFAAGDTVFIQNLGAGVCTITAGTATVNTYSSLALNQYEGGYLYFTSASAAIFYKADGAAATAGGMTSLSSGSLTSTAVTITGIDQTYKDLYIVITDPYFNVNTQAALRFNGVTSGSYNMSFQKFATALIADVDQTAMYLSRDGDGTVTNSNQGYCYIKNYSQTCSKIIQGGFATAAVDGNGTWWFLGSFESQTAITEVQIKSLNGTSTFSGGTYIIYGVK